MIIIRKGGYLIQEYLILGSGGHCLMYVQKKAHDDCPRR